MGAQNPVTGRFIIEQSSETLVLRARGRRDVIVVTADDFAITADQQRNSSGNPSIAVAQLTGIEAEKIGGPGDRTFALYLHRRDEPRILLVHTITAFEAQWLRDLLTSRYARAIGRPAPRQDSSQLEPPSVEQAWSVEDWRNQPPIG